MKQTLILLVILIGLTSCHVHDYDLACDESTIDGFVTKSTTSSNWFDFDSIIEDSTWLYKENIMERVSLIQIPDNQLSIMPLDTLLDRCIRYPFYYDFTAANTVEQGIKAVMASFNGFDELSKRQGVVNALLEKYRQYSISIITKHIGQNDRAYFSELLHEYYVELIISQYLELFSNKELGELITIFDQKTIEKERSPEAFGGLSKQVGSLLRNSIQERYNSTKPSDGNKLRSVNEMIYTTYGKSLISTIEQEGLSSLEIIALDLEQTLLHPLATLLSSSTTTYNCHSYAWHISSGGDTRWINGSLYGQPTLNGSVDSYSDNVDAYWTDGLYAATTSNRKEKIYYYRGDHSATISSSSGQYESKWGQGPLMRHSPTDCPSIYNPSYQSYYCQCSLILQCSAGIGTVSVNQSCTYSAIDIPGGISSLYSWSVCDPKGEETIGIHAFVQNATGSSAQITFDKTGIYEITLIRYHPYRGTMYYTYEALVTN